MDVTCLGELLIVLTQGSPEPLEHTESFARSLGGTEFNTAAALAFSGASTALVSVVGDDGFGRYATDTVRSLGIDTSGIMVDPHHATGLYVKELATAESSSRMHYFRAASAGSRLSPAHTRRPAVRALLDQTRIIHTTGITAALSPQAHDALTLVADERRHALLSFDVSWRSVLWGSREDEATEVLGALVSTSDIVFMTAEDASAAFGTGEPEALRQLFPEPRRLIVSSGDAVTAFDGSAVTTLERHPSTIVDAIGASDAFTGGVLSGILDDSPMATALTRGLELADKVASMTSDHVLAS